MNKLLSMMTSIGLGAGLMYYYDPNRGRRRRALVRDKFIRMKNQSDEFLEKASQDMRNRARGVMAEATALLSDKSAPDWIIEERVRAELGRLSRFSRAIDVQSHDAQITLTGPVLAEEVDRILAGVNKVRGVQGVNNQIEVHESPEGVPSLQGNPPDREMRSEIMQQNWSPTTRLLAGVGGGMLAVYGRSRRGLIGSLLSLAGLGLMARGVANLELSRLIGTNKKRLAVDVQKAINVNAPVEQVYEFWSHYENFHRFMAHVKEIRDLGNGRSHWVVAGPAGVPVEFDAMTTQQIQNKMISWKSLPGEQIHQTGVVRFDPNPDGSTRITVHMSYTPPAGILGHAVAALFGADPKQAMDDDLVRLKSLLEHGKTSVEGDEVMRQNLPGSMGATSSEG